MFLRTVLLLLVSFSYFSHASTLITGTLVDETQQPIVNAQVIVGGKSYFTNANGQYELRPERSDVYQLRITKNGYYPAVQTFSHYELSNMLVPFVISNITLVEKAQGRVMFAFTGDAMMGRRYLTPLFGDEVLLHDDTIIADSKEIVQHVKPYIEIADLATTNLETQIFNTPPNESASKSIAFYSKPAMLTALKWAGIDYVTLGNNHTYDYKRRGLEETLDYLAASGLSYSGAGLNENDALNAHTETMGNVKYAMLGYNGWEGRTKPSQVAQGNKGGPAFGNTQNITQSVTKQIEVGKIPIVQYHGGYEYSEQPSGLTEQRLKTAIDQGAALAIAHHPHVTQGLELYNGQLIAYSMGNFIFDQYIPATPYSFILYVWLDKGAFHRAELVPIYLKGYKPTPATGYERFVSLTRLSTLSAQRHTKMSASGGHGVIVVDRVPQKKPSSATYLVKNDAFVKPLYHQPFDKKVAMVTLPKGVKYRLGKNLMNGSDFESFDLFNSPERSWFFDRKHTSVNKYGASGFKSLGLSIDAGEVSSIGLQPFRRIFKGDNPTTVTAKIKTSQNATIRFYWQGRRYGQGFLDARKESKKHLIGSVDIAGHNNWQTIELDFNSIRHNFPSTGYRAYRVMADISLKDNATGKVDIDDFAVIEWQTAFSSQPRPIHTDLDSRQAAYIGFNKLTNENVSITLH